MKVILGPGCDKAWRDSLSPWEREQLAAIHRQGRGLRDRTNHGSDRRWEQRGVVTYMRLYRGRVTEGPRRHGHEAVVIERTDEGYTMTGVHREHGYDVDFETGALAPTVQWVITWRWWVSERSSANYPPHNPPEIVERARARHAAGL